MNRYRNPRNGNQADKAALERPTEPRLELQLRTVEPSPKKRTYISSIESPVKPTAKSPGRLH